MHAIFRSSLDTSYKGKCLSRISIATKPKVLCVYYAYSISTVASVLTYCGQFLRIQHVDCHDTPGIQTLKLFR